VAAGGTTFASSVLTNRAPMDGSVTICATAIATAAVPALDPRGLVLLALLLAGLGVLAARSSKPRFLARRR
jgi:IPTL-CTERM motif